MLGVSGSGMSFPQAHGEVGGLYPSLSPVTMSTSMSCAAVTGPCGQCVGSQLSGQAPPPSS